MGLLIILRYRQGLELSEKCQTVEDSIDLLTKCPNDVSFFDRRIFHQEKALSKRRFLLRCNLQGLGYPNRDVHHPLHPAKTCWMVSTLVRVP